MAINPKKIHTNIRNIPINNLLERRVPHPKIVRRWHLNELSNLVLNEFYRTREVHSCLARIWNKMDE